MKQTYNDTSKNYLGYKTNKMEKKWLALSTQQSIENRCKINLGSLIHIQKDQRINTKKSTELCANKEVKKLRRKDRRAYVNNITPQAEESARKKEQGPLYAMTKLVCASTEPTQTSQ